MKATRAILKAVAAAEAEGRVTSSTGRAVVTGPVVALGHPPSTNNLFVTIKGRRFKSQQYRDWLAAAVPLARHLKGPAAYPCAVEMVICGDTNESRDADNFQKAVLDCLVDAGVLMGDSLRHVRKLSIEYRPADHPEAVVLVTIGEG